MMKLLLRSMLLACVILAFTREAKAQLYCPIKLYNSSQYVLIQSDYVYNTFVNGNYQLTLFRNDGSCIIVDATVSISKVADLSTYMSAVPGSGVVFSIPGTDCPVSENDLQAGGTSMKVIRASDGVQVFSLNFYDNEPDECDYTPLPVIFTSTSSSFVSSISGDYARIQWSTSSESSMDHFTVEKTTFAPGSSWVKVAQVAAQNTTTANYEWKDFNPIFKGYYRIVGVDINCKKTYTRILVVNCATCPASFSPPSLTPDCYSPVAGVYISGDTGVCNTTRRIYRLNNVTGEATTTWSLSPSNLGTLTSAGRMVLLTPSGTAGVGILTATVVRAGQTTTYTKRIIFGIPPITVTIYNTLTPDMGEGVMLHEVYTNFFPGTTGNEYTWYEPDFNYSTPTNVYMTRYVMPGQTFEYTITWNGPCGPSVYYGSYTVPWYGARMASGYTVSPNPVKGGQISISIQTPGNPALLKRPSLKILSGGGTIEVQVYDRYGNLRKTAKVKPVNNRLIINAPELPAGLYYLHVTEKGKDPAKLKVWIEK